MANLVAEGRADAASRGGLAERRPNRLAVGQTLGAHDLERGSGCVIEADVEGSSHTKAVAQILLQTARRVANSGGLVFVDEAA